jgi:ribosome-binding protein aMBF1 (putative translation factor)
MSLHNKDLAEKSFEALSKSIGETDRIMIETRLLMYRFLSEIDKITSERGINRKQLAKLAGTSASYITQLYQGKKIINLQMLAKIKKALNIEFKIEITDSEKTKKEYTVLQGSKLFGKSIAHTAAHGTHGTGKLIHSKVSKSDPRAQKSI